jgi:hypothetical protein
LASLWERFSVGLNFGSRPDKISDAMSKAEAYRSYALQCLALAQKVTDPRDQTALAHIATTWHELATREERSETQRMSSPLLMATAQQTHRLIRH